MAFKHTSGRVGLQAIATASTTKLHELGLICNADDPDYGSGEFIYLLGVGSTTVGSWVTYNMDNGGTALLAANGVGPVAVAMSANIASQYGWYQIGGKAVGACLTNFADNAQVWITATGGSIDDASVAGDLVNNAKGASTTVDDSGVADFEISRPFVDNISSAT